MRLDERLGATVQVTRLSQALGSPVLLAEVLRDGRPLVERGDAWRKVKRRERATVRAADAVLTEAWAELIG